MNVETLKQVSIGAWVTLSILIASCMAIVIFAPAHFWSSLAAADWGHVAGVITLVGTAFVAVFVDATRRLAAIDAQPALGTPSQRPTDRETTRTRREGSTSTATIVMVALFAIICVIAVALSGCGSVIGTQARAATVAAVATQCAARVVAETATHEARTTCPHETYAPGTAELTACLVPVRARWAPADAAVASVRATLAAWVEALELARLAGDGTDLWQPLALAAARLVHEYDALAETLRTLGVEAPALPPLVLDASELIGGE